jgi:uncharacterized protein (DUF2164 family)
LLTKEERQRAIDGIIGYFASERKETIGIIAAEDLLDFFLQNAGKSVYNTALEHARVALQKGSEETGFAISELRR